MPLRLDMIYLIATDREFCRQRLDAVWIPDGINLDDPALGDGESHDGEGTPSPDDDDTRGPIHEGGKDLGSAPGSYSGRSGNGLCAANDR